MPYRVGKCQGTKMKVEENEETEKSVWSLQRAAGWFLEKMHEFWFNRN